MKGIMNSCNAKQSKCMFACNEVEYLGHLIFGEGVRTDPKKIAAMQQWLVPKDVKALRGFLGLIEYYRKFVRGYGQIAAPLTALLKKDSFVWTSEADIAFQRLKKLFLAPQYLPCLILPNPSLWKYKQGKENVVADALFRRQCDAAVVPHSNLAQSEALVLVASGSCSSDACDASTSTLCTISFPTPSWLSKLKSSYDSDTKLKAILQNVQSGSNSPLGFTFCNGLLSYKGRLYLGDFNQDLKAVVLQQKLKHKTYFPIGLLQPLPIPEKLWLDVSMDFVEGLPKSHLKSVVFVVVDRLNKYTHFMAFSHPYTAAKVANLYLHFVFKLHGMPSTIVSDRDPVFNSLFWKELMKLQGVSLAMSSAYHPQSDGQIEVVNKSLEHYLRAFAAGLVGEVSYKLDLPLGSLIHLVFHVSNLKAKLGNQVVPKPTLPAVNADLVLTLEPVMILDRKSIKLRSRTMTQLLVQWQGESGDDATWEVLYDLQARFPHLVGKVL
nr:uncharacterized protein LOC112033747 [Quercus suber]